MARGGGSGDETLLVMAFGAIVLTIFAALAWVMREKCPHCEKRGTVGWVHRRTDGGPDRRYKHNFRRCSACGRRVD